MSNQVTLDSYELGVEPYIANTATQVNGLFKEWIDTTLSLLPKAATILEIGSSFGRDARYIEAKGYSVERTDATKGFIQLLEKQGYSARQFNVLTQDFTSSYDLIFANAVFLHFTPAELETVLGKISEALLHNGLLAFSVKPGEGEEWTSAKIGHPRYFCYWRKEPLCALVKSKGFDLLSIGEDETFLRLTAKKQ
jgi:predicted TPR repeat methyltransferase